MNRRIMTAIATTALAFSAIGAQASWFSKKDEAAKTEASTTAKSPTHLRAAAEKYKHGQYGRHASSPSVNAPLDPVNMDDVSYGIGFMMGSNFNKQKMDVNKDQFVKGFEQGVSGKEGKFSQEEVRKMMMNYQRTIMKKRMDERKAQAATNKAASEKFFADNKAKSGVKTLASGLQYKIIEEGTGPQPALTDTVKVTYTGHLIDGEEFSSSNDPANPAEFRVNGVIKAWQEALPMMKQGATWELYVPADLAYGERGAGAKIGPNAALIFNIKLHEVEKKVAADESAEEVSSDK